MCIAGLDHRGIVLISPRISWQQLEGMFKDLREALLAGKIDSNTATAIMTACPTMYELLLAKKEAPKESAPAI